MLKLDAFGSQQLLYLDCWPVLRRCIAAPRLPRQPKLARPALTMRSGSAAIRCQMWRAPRRASSKTGKASARYAGRLCQAAESINAIAGTLNARVISHAVGGGSAQRPPHDARHSGL